MSGKGRPNVTPRRGRPPSTGSSRNGLRAPYRPSPGGHLVRGTRRVFSLAGPTSISPTYSAAHGANERLDTTQMNRFHGAQRAPDQQYTLNAGSRPTLTASSYSLPSTLAQNPSVSVSPSTLSKETQRQPFLVGEATPEVGQKSEVIMAVAVNENGALGCAYYSADKNSVCLLQDIPCTEPLHLVETLMLQCQPTTILLSLKIPDVILNFFEQRKSTVYKGDLPS